MPKKSPKNKVESLKAYVPIGLPNREVLLQSGLNPERIYLLFHQLFLSRLGQIIGTPKHQWMREQGYVPIDSQLLKKILTRNYIKYVNYAEDQGWIIRRRDTISGGIKYRAGEHCQLMGISHLLLLKEGTIRHFRKEIITDYKSVKAVLSVRESYKKNRFKSNWHFLVNKTHLEIVAMSQMIKFSMDLAETFIEKKYKNAKSHKTKELTQSYVQVMEAINDGNVDFYKVDIYGNRLHTSLTGIYAPLREFIYFENDPRATLVQIDLRNSQVYLVACMLAHPDIVASLLPEFSCVTMIANKYRSHDDVIDFYKECHQGNIYESIATTFPTEKELSHKEFERLRNRTKKATIAHLYSNPKMARTDSKPNAIISHFESHYPNVLRAILEIKSLDENAIPFNKYLYVDKTGKYFDASYKNISRMAQLLESRILLGLVAPALIEQGLTPFTTIHDSFIIPKGHALKTMELIEHTFKELGLVPPSLKTTYLNGTLVSDLGP
jgi:hypothetical protein